MVIHGSYIQLPQFSGHLPPMVLPFQADPELCRVC